MKKKIIPFVVSLLLFIVAAVFSIFGDDVKTSNDVITATFYFGIVIISGITMICIMLDKNPLKVMNLHNFKKNYKYYLYGMVIAFISTLAIFGVIYLSGNIVEIKFNPSNFVTLFYLIIIFVIQSLYEEVLFRSVAFNFLLKRFGFLTAIISTALLFSLLHINNQHFSLISFINIMIFGLFAGVMVHKQKNIYFVSGFHFGWNYLQALLLGVISGISIDEPLFSTVITDNPLSGGSFGFEASYLATIAFFILLVISFNYRVKRDNFKWIIELPLAHRGYFNEVNPENSIGAFKEAVRNGFAIELDIQLSKDDEVVVFHDSTLNRLCGINAKVKDYNVSDLKTFKLSNSDWTITTLKEVLEVVDGKVPLIIEIKNNGKPGILERLTYEILSNYHGEYVVQSFNPFSMMWFVNHAPHIIRGQLSGRHDDKNSADPISRFFLRHVLFNFLAQVDFINFDIHYDNFRARYLHKRMYKIGYTARSIEEYKEAMTRFDNVIFDDFIYDEQLKANSFTNPTSKGKISK